MLTKKSVTLTAAAAAMLTMTGLASGALGLGHPQPTTETGGNAATGQAEGLETVEGTVERRGDDIDDLQVRGVELDFGPDRWVRTAGPGEDYDQDGRAEALRDELDGLVGNQASFLVRLDNDGDDGDVYQINGMTYRDQNGPPPWAASRSGGKAASENEVRQAAAAAVGDGARVVDLEADDGPVAWEADVLDTQGRDHDVKLDADGKVLSVERD